jgi:hypothetical protein
MSERGKSGGGKKNKPSEGALPGALPPNKYVSRIRWDEKAKMFTLVDIPKKRIKKD